jgi:hypothetical protein
LLEIITPSGRQDQTPCSSSPSATSSHRSAHRSGHFNRCARRVTRLLLLLVFDPSVMQPKPPFQETHLLVLLGRACRGRGHSGGSRPRYARGPSIQQPEKRARWLIAPRHVQEDGCRDTRPRTTMYCDLLCISTAATNETRPKNLERELDQIPLPRICVGDE